jgi:hypothetical protein
LGQFLCCRLAKLLAINRCAIEDPRDGLGVRRHDGNQQMTSRERIVATRQSELQRDRERSPGVRPELRFAGGHASA